MDFEYLKQILEYEPDTGTFRWKISKRGGRGIKSGDIAGYMSHEVQQRTRIMIDGKSYLAHRLAWFYMKGKWPECEIDHIDGDASNNKFSNLREATNSQQQWNKRRPRNNTSGFKGVIWYKIKEKWRAQIAVDGKTIYLGFFDDAKEAALVYNYATERYHGEFAVFNQVFADIMQEEPMAMAA